VCANREGLMNLMSLLTTLGVLAYTKWMHKLYKILTDIHAIYACKVEKNGSASLQDFIDLLAF
jgi:hypothetical protein